MDSINKKQNSLKHLILITLALSLISLPALKVIADVIYETPSESLPNFDLLTDQQRKEGFDRLELEHLLTVMPLTTKRLQQAADYFKAKEDDKARAALDINLITQEQDELLNKLTKQPELQISLDEKASELILLAQLTAIDYKLGDTRINTAISYFEQALKSGRTPERLNNYAIFAQKQNQWELAEQLYTEALSQQRKQANNQAIDQDYLINFLNRLGDVKQNLGQLDEAFVLQTEALTLSRQLITDEPASMLQLSVILGSLSQLSLADNKRNDAIAKLYKETINTLRPLAASSPDTYLPTLAELFNTLGMILGSKPATDQQAQEIEQSYTEALKSYRQLAEADANSYLPNVATILNNLAGLLLDKHPHTRRSEIEKLLTEALSINRQLSNSHPDPYLRNVYQGNLIRTLEILGRAYLSWKEPAQAQTYLQEALQLAETKPTEYQYQLITIKEILNKIK